MHRGGPRVGDEADLASPRGDRDEVALRALVVAGEDSPIAAAVEQILARAEFSVSRTGTLPTATSESDVVLVDLGSVAGARRPHVSAQATPASGRPPPAVIALVPDGPAEMGAEPGVLPPPWHDGDSGLTLPVDSDLRSLAALPVVARLAVENARLRASGADLAPPSVAPPSPAPAGREFGPPGHSRAGRFRALVETAPTAIYETDAEGRCIYVNDKWCELAGLTPEEALGDGWQRGVHEEDRARIHASWREHARDAQPWDMEYRFRTPEGRVSWVLGRAQALRDARGRVTGYIGINIDISARKRAELSRQAAQAEQAKERELFENVLESMSDGVLVLDDRFHFAFMNAALERIAKTRRQQLVGAGVRPWDVFPHLVEQGVDEMMRRAMDGEVVEREGIPYVLPDGTEGVTSEIYLPLRGSSGRPHGIVGVIRDITDYTRVLEALRAKERQIRLLLHSTAEAIYGLDLEGRCTFANPACARLLGYEEAAELIGQPMHRLIHHTRPDGTTYPEEDCPIHRAIRRDEKSHVVDEVLWRKDGSSFPAEYWSYPISRDGVVEGFAVTFLDITERRRVEQEKIELERGVQQAHRLESLGVLAGGIAHDFNNVLMGILGHADLALDELPQDAPVCPHLEGIVAAAQHASGLTNQMLAYSGRGHFLVEPICLGELVREMSDLLAISIAKSVQFRLELGETLPAVEADAAQMRQVVLNLVTNASESIGPDGGTVTLRTRTRELRAADLAGLAQGEQLPPVAT